VSVLVVAQSSSEVPEGLMNNPVFCCCKLSIFQVCILVHVTLIGVWNILSRWEDIPKMCRLGESGLDYLVQNRGHCWAVCRQ